MLAARVGEFVAADAMLRLALFGFVLQKAAPDRAEAMRRAEDRILAGLSALRELVQGIAMTVRPPSRRRSLREAGSMRISISLVDLLAVAGGLAVIVGAVAINWALGIIAIGAGLVAAAVYLTRLG